MTTKRPEVSPDDIVGSWRLSFNYGPEKIVDLLPGGRIANHDDAWWKLDGSQLLLFWPGKPPTEGSDPDSCFIEPGKDAFVGRDQAGAVIRGKMLNQ